MQELISVHFSHSVVSDFLWPHGLQHTRLPCPSPSLGACSNLCPLNQWCHPTISSSVVPFSSCLHSFPASESFLFPSGGQSIGASASASVLPMTIQDWFPLGSTGWISLQSNQSILTEISPGISLERMMLKLKLQSFGHLMQRVDSLEKTLIDRKSVV